MGKDETKEDPPEAKAEEKDAGKEDVAMSTAIVPAEQSIATRAANAKITQDGFARLIRVYYKVIKDIVLSDSLHIEQSKHIRRLEIGEVVEVLNGPQIDPSIGIY